MSTGTGTAAAQAGAPTTGSSDPLVGRTLWVDPDNDAARELAQRGQPVQLAARTGEDG